MTLNHFEFKIKSEKHFKRSFDFEHLFDLFSIITAVTESPEKALAFFNKTWFVRRLQSVPFYYRLLKAGFIQKVQETQLSTVQ